MSNSRSKMAEWSAPEEMEGLKRKAWIVAAIGVAASLGGLFLDRPQFFQSYLVSWLFWLGITMGCFALMTLHHLTRGAWGLMVRRILEAATRNLPFVALAFIPIVVGIQEIYLWARPEAASDELIQQKASYLNPMAFTIRSFAYMAVWTLFAWSLLRLSKAQDESGDPTLFRKMQMISAAGLVIYCLLSTFASIDWLMSLDPHWYSSIFGVYFIIGQALAGIAFVIVVARYLSKREPLEGVLQPRHIHDYGNLMLAFVMLWAYIAVSQMLIIWSGDLPEEVIWYLERVQGNWQYVSIALGLFHFLLPFLILLSRGFKRRIGSLIKVAVFLLIMRWIDLFWLAAPTFHHHLSLHWLDLTTLAAVGGAWLALFIGNLQKRPLIPVNDPYLEEALRHE